MPMIDTVKAALMDKAPALYSSLRKSGKLNAWVKDKAEEINAAIGARAREIAEHHGYSKLLQTDPMKAVGTMNMAKSLATEAVLAEMLEFPPAQT